MSVRFARFLASGVLAAGVLGATAGAQTPKPSPSPPPPPPPPAGFSAHAHANVTVTAQGGLYDGSAQLGVSQRTGLIRIDVLSLKSDTFPIPPITVTAIVDRRANTITLWNDTTKQYRVQPFLPRPSPSPRASATPTAAPARPRARGVSPFSTLDVLDVSLKLSGHTTTAGIATTGLIFDLQVRKKGDTASSHVTATTQLADDFTAFPMTIDLSLEPGAAPFSAHLAYAVDDLTPSAPPVAAFRIPAGYTEARSLMNVLFPARPPALRSPSPRPASSP